MIHVRNNNVCPLINCTNKIDKIYIYLRNYFDFFVLWRIIFLAQFGI